MKNFVLCTCLLVSAMAYGQSSNAALDPAEPTIVGVCRYVAQTSDDGKTSTQRSVATNMKCMSRKYLLSRDAELVADYPEQTTNAANLTVKSFTAQILGKKYECTGNKFSDDAQKAINQLKSADKITLSDILVTDKAGREVPLKPCEIIIR